MVSTDSLGNWLVKSVTAFKSFKRRQTGFKHPPYKVSDLRPRNSGLPQLSPPKTFVSWFPSTSTPAITRKSKSASKNPFGYLGTGHGTAVDCQTAARHVLRDLPRLWLTIWVELQTQYTTYKNNLQQLAQKIGDVEQETEEHK